MTHIEGPVFQAQLPFRWQAQTITSTASEWEILRYLPVLADFEQNHAAGDLAQAKQDLALLWLARQQPIALPACTQLELGMGDISWHSDDALAVGATGTVSLSLSQTFPLLLSFQAQIVRGTQGGGQVIAQLQNLSPVLRDLWEQTIFRYHRRAIQQAKQATA